VALVWAERNQLGVIEEKKTPAKSAPADGPADIGPTPAGDEIAR
jgi:hypothetical protein